MADDDVNPSITDELDPAVEPKSSKAWLAIIAHAEKEFRTYQEKADNIDKQYANLERLASVSRDRQMQMFWANIAVLGPSIYSRPPIPVVTPRFRDRKPVPRLASELLERSTIVAFEKVEIDRIMRLVRDDLVTVGRGCAWLRYEAASQGDNLTEKVCIEHADRKDFLHDPARTWADVDWVSKRSWLTKKEARKRFSKSSGKAYQDLAYEIRKDDDSESNDNVKKAGVWELWCKSQNKVVWVGEGADKLLDDDKPHLTLEGFFPCPPPAYGTLERRSLKPVPDMLFYKDQLEEINELTTRISALTDAVKLRGFYPAGAGEIGDAVEAAIKNQADNVVLIPVSNWAMLGGGNAKDMIVWLPLADVVAAITGLVELRKQLIDDVYQITGLSDIMRGATDARETLGAQELKSQYGSIRVRDRQDELIRFARDITRISAEIMAENFQAKTLLAMSGLEPPTDKELAEKAKPLRDQIEHITRELQKAANDPQIKQLAQANPEQAQQAIQAAQQQQQQAQSELQKIGEMATIEKVMKLLKEERIRPFVLDIETDSTIAPDENAQKQRATEFITAVGGFMGQAFPLVQVMPQAAPVTAEFLKFIASQFRAGREMEGKIEEFADQMASMAQQPKPPDPAQVKGQMDAEAHQRDTQAKAIEQDLRSKEAGANQEREEAKFRASLDAMDRDEDRKVQEQNIKLETLAEARANAAQKHAQEMDLGALALEKMRLDIRGIQVKTEATVATTEAKIEQSETQTDNSIATTEAGIEAKQAAANGKEQAAA